MKKVLVIDDMPEVRNIVSETLSSAGYFTFEAPDGAVGLRTAREERPDLILCDVQMPVMDGYETLNALRTQSPHANTPFIFISGASDKINVRRGMDLGADDYVTKPFTPQELVAAVNTRLAKHVEAEKRTERQLNELRGNITLALPHELRTPLNAILGLADLMIEDYAKMPREEVLESAHFVRQSALRLHRLIENFLVYSQIELMASEKKLIETGSVVSPVAAHRVVPDIARSVALRHRRDSDLTLEVDSIHLVIPEENLAKIVEELVDNAFKFSQAGQPVRVSATAGGETFQLSVADGGRGMTEEQIERVGPHMQFDRRTFEQQGAGLGLVIAKRMTELLGGQFKINSQPGATTVQITFPLPSF